MVDLEKLMQPLLPRFAGNSATPQCHRLQAVALDRISRSADFLGDLHDGPARLKRIQNLPQESTGMLPRNDLLSSVGAAETRQRVLALRTEG